MSAAKPSQPDPIWLDEQYNNRARIPEHPALFDNWRQRSAQARAMASAAGACQLDLAYGPGADERLDIFQPVIQPLGKAGPAAPVLVFVHGGYWRALDKSDHSFLAPAWQQAGALVVVPNYSLCPAVKIEHICLQMARMVAWLVEHVAEFGGDPSRIVLAGHSAGGHIAAMLLCCDWQAVAPGLPAEPLRAGVSLSGLFDLEPLRHAPFIAPDLQLDPASVARLSPAGFAAPKKPLLALVGGNESEEFLRQNLLIRQRWGKKTVPVCEALPGRHHLDVLDELALADGRAFKLTRPLLGL